VRRAAVIVIAACSHRGAPHDPPPANHLEPSGAETTRMVVRVFPLYDSCERVHHLALAMDGQPVGVIETHAKCAPKPIHTGSGATIIVSDSGGRSDDSAPFDVPAGHHVIEILDRETQLVDHIEREFPQYEELQQHRVLDMIGVAAEDNKLRILGLGHDFLSL